MSDIPPDDRYEALQRSVFGAVPEPELRRLAGEVRESRLLAGHLLYEPEVTVVTAGLLRSFIGDGTGRQITIAYIRPRSASPTWPVGATQSRSKLARTAACSSSVTSAPCSSTAPTPLSAGQRSES